MIEDTKSKNKIRIAIVDDHAMFREGLAAILSNEPDFEIAGLGGSAQDAVRIAHDELPEILLMDIDMPGGGLNAAREISGDCPVSSIIILTASENDEHLINALKLGVRGFVLKGIASRELIRIIRSVAEGESYVPPALAASLLLEMKSKNANSGREKDPIEDLTAREREILESLAQGMSNKEIADKLFLSEKTVKHYMTNILQKLQVRNRVEAALIAQKHISQGLGE